MIARIAHKVLFCIAIAAAMAIAAVPVYMGAGPSGTVQSFGGALGAALAPVLAIALLAVISMVSSLFAFIAAIVAHEPLRAKLICGLPVLLAALVGTAAMLILIERGTFR